MSEHTAGPWTPFLRDRTSNPPYVMKQGESSGWIAQTCTWMGIDEAEANARLIAASPDLLAALKFIVQPQPYSATQEWRDNVKKGREMALAAIAKAEGSTLAPPPY